MVHLIQSANVFIDLSYFCSDENLNNYINTAIPTAHDYNPTVRVALDVVNVFGRYYLDVLVSVDGNDGSDTASWDKPEDLNFEQVFVDVTQPNGGQQEIFVSAKINGIVKSDTAILSSGNNDNGDNTISINGSYQSDTLTLTVATDTDTSSTSILIPLRQNIDNFVNNDLDKRIFNIINNTMNCELTPVLIAIQNCCEQLAIENNENQALLDALYFLIELRTGQLETISNDILNEVTKTITGTTYTVDCETVDENGNITPTETEIEGISFQGLATLITDLNQKIGNTNVALCSAQEEDVVAIIASERDLTRVQGKQLILHFVTLDNYPTRARDSNYRPIQIPAPREEYDWDEDFKPIEWTQGNFYCELQLKTSGDILVKPPVSGYFENKNKADEFFDVVLGLTTLSEANRKYHEFDSPKRNILVQKTRPYRAFITSVDENGKAVCETKYIPPIEGQSEQEIGAEI